MLIIDNTEVLLNVAKIEGSKSTIERVSKRLSKSYSRFPYPLTRGRSSSFLAGTAGI